MKKNTEKSTLDLDVVEKENEVASEPKKKKRLKKSTRTAIITSSVAIALVILVPLWVFLIGPLLTVDNSGESSSVVTPVEGEGTYYGNLSLYPSIDVKDIISIKVNNDFGELEFISHLDPDTVTRELRLKQYPSLDLDDSVLSYLRVPVLIAMCTSNTPLRNLTPEQMATYHTTPETCIASFTVEYYEGATQKSQTVYIGDRSPSSVSSRFVSVAGRNSVYEIASMLESGLLIPKEGFVNPLINSMYSETEAVYAIKTIMIGNSGAPKPYIGIGATKQEFQDSLVIKHTVRFPDIANGVAADTTYISDVITKLLVSFKGESVVVIDPTAEEKEKYGVSINSSTKTIYIDTFDTSGGKSLDLGITISQLQTDEEGNSYYYILTSDEGSDIPLIVRISGKDYEFLEEKNAIKWIATNSIDSGFTKYIYENEQEGESGVASIEILSNTGALRDFHDIFYLSTAPHPTKEGKLTLTVTTQSGLYTFADNLDAELSEDKNQFNNFYSVLVNYPMPNRFNTMSEEQRQALKTPENLVLSLRVTMKDGTVLGYDYYKIDSANVMCEFFDEKNTTPRVVFDTTTEHINILATALKQLISGEKVEKK